MIILSYTVTLNAEGGEAAYETKKVPYGTEIEEPTATRSGYNFIAWVDADGKEVEFPYAVKADVTFKAKWEKGPVFTVVYEPVDGVTYKTKSTYNVKTGDKHTLKAATDLNYTNAAKSLKNWLVRPADAVGTDSAVEYAAGEEITVSGNLIVTPVLSSTITVTFKDGIDEAAVFTAHATADGFNYVKNGGADFNVMGAAATASIGDGGTVVIDNEPTKVGYTFAGYCIIEPEWADRDETIVKKDATTNKPIYKTITFDPAEPVTDDDGDGVVYVHVMWDAVDLNAVVYSDETNTFTVTETAGTPDTIAIAAVTSKPYDSFVKGLTLNGDKVIAADEAAEINLTYDALVKKSDATTTTGAVPAIFVKAPDKIDANYGVSLAYYSEDEYAAEIKKASPFGSVTGATVADAKVTMDIDDEENVKGARIPVGTEPYVVLQFTDVAGNATHDSEKYVINLTSYAAEDLCSVAVDMGVDPDPTDNDPGLYKGEAKAANLVKPNVEYFDVCTLQMPIGAKIETPAAGAYIKKVGTVESGFEGLDVLDHLNKPVEAADGVYTVAGDKMTVSFNWGSMVTVSFDTTGVKTTGPQMETLQKAAKSEFALPENEFEPATDGYVFAGWKVGTPANNGASWTYGADIRQPGYIVTLTGDIKLQPQWDAGNTVTFYAGYGDDLNTDKDEAGSKVFTVLKNATGTDREVAIPDKIDETWGWKVPENVRFGGWIQSSATGDGVAPQATSHDNVTTDKTLTVTSGTNYRLTAKWLPVLNFESSDADYIATLGVKIFADDASRKQLPKLVITKDTEADDDLHYIIKTEGDVPVPYGKGNASFWGAGFSAGNYIAMKIAPSNVNYFKDATMNAPTSGDYTPMSNYLDVLKDGTTSDFDTHVSLLAYDDKNFTLTFKWGNNVTEAYVFDVSGLTYSYPVTYDMGYADAAGEEVTETVAVKYNDLLAEPATAPTRDGYTLTGWRWIATSDVATIDTAGTEFDKLDEAKVTKPITMVAQWTEAKYTLSVDFGEGDIATGNDYSTRVANIVAGSNSETKNEKAVAIAETKKSAKFGDGLVLPKATEMKKAGNTLVSWTVNGIETKAGNVVTVKGNITIVANWKSSLATLEVAPLTDTSTPVITNLYKEGTYALGTMEANATTGVPEFVAAGENWTGKSSTTADMVYVTIHAEELKQHKNKIYDSNTGAAGYWVGIKFTAPEGLDIASYTATVAGESESATKTPIKDGGFVLYYDATNAVNQVIGVRWYDADDNKKAAIGYTITSNVTKLYSTYSFDVTLSGGTLDAGSGQLSQTNLDNGEAIDSVSYTSTGDSYFDQAKLDAITSASTWPSTITASLEPTSDGLHNTIVIEGTAGGTTQAIAINLTTIVGTKTAYTIKAKEATFEATGANSGVVTNNSTVDMKVGLDAGSGVAAWYDLKAGKTYTFNSGVTTTNVKVKKVEDLTHKESAEQLVTVTADAPTNANAIQWVAGVVKGDLGYVKGFVDGVSYQVQINGGSWTAATITNGFYRPTTDGDYLFRTVPTGTQLSALSTAASGYVREQSAILAAGSNVTFKKAGKSDLTGEIGAGGKLTEQSATLVASYGTSWKVMTADDNDTGIVLTIGADTVFSVASGAAPGYYLLAV